MSTVITADGRRAAQREDVIVNANTDVQRRLVTSLGNRIERQTGRPVRMLETHISYVLLTGAQAYKIKKAVDLGFLDFTTLAARRLFCEEELRLNRRLAPLIYRRVVAITGSDAGPEIGGSGPVLEYAVEMVEFAQESLLSAVLARGSLSPHHIDMLAQVIAQFHASIDCASASSAYGRPGRILERAVENFTVLRTLLQDMPNRHRLDVIDRWTHREHAARLGVFEERRRGGYVRECHGDLHLGNIVLLDEAIVPFDCIEFNDELRWIDVISEVAFTVMDLDARGQPRLASRMLNAYLESTGDYAGVRVLHFYLVYRAMVRAKIAAIRASQVTDLAAHSALHAECSDYLDLALRYTSPRQCGVVVTHGLSGSGKTTLTQPLLEHLGAIRVRSDVERKRMHGLAARERTNGSVGAGIYAPDATVATYDALLALAGAVLDGGYPVIVDATFLRRWQRAMFDDLAVRWNVPFVILTFAASVKQLRERVLTRAQRETDASEATVEVLERQVATEEVLTAREAAHEVAFDTGNSPARAELVDAWLPLMHALSAHPAGSMLREPQKEAEAPLEAKLEFLRCPRSYREGVSEVSVVETHLSWVFLTSGEAFKLKKPVCTDFMDLRSLHARGQNCSEEVILNRRLTNEVYRGVVALTLEAPQRFAFDGVGPVIDWLVRMRRLPAQRMLDRVIRVGVLRHAELVPVVGRLCDMYLNARRAGWSADEYCERLEHGIEQNRRELARFAMHFPHDLVTTVLDRQQTVLHAHRQLFEDRAKSGRIVEGHGDLRPEHICLESPPQIIDCLEFYEDLRMLDPVDELGFLALECARLRAPELKRVILSEYQRRTGDAPDPRLVHFYQSYRATIRSRLAISHLHDGFVREPARWHMQARAYLERALAHAEAAG